MFQNRLFSLDSVVPLPAARLKDFVEGAALHASRRTVKLIGTREGYPYSGCSTWTRQNSSLR